MRRIALIVLAGSLLATAPAEAASSTFTIRGAGWGHGVGMSQFGALGYAKRGSSYREILRHYYTGTSLGQAPDGKIVRVLLHSSRQASFTGATKAGNRPLQASKVYRVRSRLDGRVELRSPTNRRLATFAAPLTVTSRTPITVRGKSTNGLRDGQYRGWMEFRPGAVGEVLAVNALGLEQYVAGVVAAESPSSWPAAALQAQAVAARTYALTTGGNGSRGFEQYADVRSQVYRGVVAETGPTNAAVNATRGQVVTAGGRPVVTYFFSTSGGKTENVEHSFIGSRPQSHLKAVDDPYDTESPHHRWTVRTTLGKASKALGGLVKGKFRGIEVIRRGGSPRIVFADVVGSRGRTRVTGPTLRKELGLRDTWASFRAITSEEDEPTGGDTPAAARAAAQVGGVLAGRITPIKRGAEVRVQRRVKGRWRQAAVTIASARGTYRTTVPAAGLYRVVVTGAVGPVVRVGR
jgi:stage II sporulation protein D